MNKRTGEVDGDLKPVRKKMRTSEESSDDWIGSVLSGNPVIVSNMVRCLSAKQLNRMSSVCSLWRDCVAKEKKRRLHIQHFGYTQHLLDDESEAGDNPSEFSSCEAADLGAEFYQVTDSLSSEPRVVFMFTTQRVVNKGRKYFPDFSSTSLDTKATTDLLKKTKRRTYSVALCNHLSSLLPVQTDLFLCTSWGIVCSNQGSPVEHEDKDGLTCLYLPNIPGVHFTTFRLLQKDCKPPISAETAIKLSGLEGISPKGLIVFSHEMPDPLSPPSMMLEHLIVTNPQMALGGAVVCNFSVPVPSPRNVVSMAGLAIHGENVTATSVLLPPACRGSRMVEEKLAILKDVQLCARSVAFLFACSGRGSHFHQELNVEAGVFGRMFPGIPLIGLFGNGELGFDSLLPPEGSSGFRDWTHGYTSIILVLSFNLPNS